MKTILFGILSLTITLSALYNTFGVNPIWDGSDTILPNKADTSGAIVRGAKWPAAALYLEGELLSGEAGNTACTLEVKIQITNDTAGHWGVPLDGDSIWTYNDTATAYIRSVQTPPVKFMRFILKNKSSTDSIIPTGGVYLWNEWKINMP